MSKIKWARLPVSNQWAAKAKAGGGTSRAQAGNTGEATHYEQVMFKPGMYLKEDIDRLRSICTQPGAALAGRRLRLATDDEWKIIAGLSEGTIVCRQLPAFLKSVLGSHERLRLYKTIQKQVEGELVMKLRNGMSVKASRHSTRAIKESILLAAQRSKTNVHELHQMFNLAKTISYNHAQQSMHFFFFDRATAKKFELVMIPYKGMVHRVRNMHGPDAGTVWDPQLDRYGVRTAERTMYEVKMYNITRFMDIGRLTTYLQQNTAAEVKLEDLDVCTPNSKTSTVLKLTVKMAGCPEFLRGIIRIIWFGLTIILKHPNASTLSISTGHGSRVAKEADVAELEDLAKPFATLEEVKTSAAQRLLIQESEEQQAQAAVTPAVAKSKSQLTEVENKSRLPNVQCNGDTDPSTGSVKQQQETKVEPKPKRAWVTVPLGGGRKLHGHQPVLGQRQLRTTSRYAELEEDSEPEGEDNIAGDDKTIQQPMVEISSGSSQEKRKPPQISKSEKDKLNLVVKKPAEMPTIPLLLTLKQRERTTLSKILQPLAEHTAGYAIMEKVRPVQTDGFKDLESNLGLTEVNTPSSGNCMAMALAQAVANHDLAAHDGVLEQATASIKRGIKVAGQMNMDQQFGHYARMNTLVNVNRGW
ncbi:hypothetical protein V7S43_007123 [Phytophthora oleae]|uniref:Uncharacterized protein n=1 Tax=Phytophthora oleae TaxID=2107226 RepID=A0ABD3FPM4_9STRA